MRSVAITMALAGLVASGCDGDGQAAVVTPGQAVVVTSPVLGAVVREVVGDAAPVVVLMPNGADPHEWKPSPRDVEALHEARFVVSNGLDLEVGLEDTLDDLRADGVPVFEAADHVRIRHGENGGQQDHHDAHADGGDPHLWTSAENMAEVAAALTAELQRVGLDVSKSGAMAVTDLEALDREVRDVLAVVPPERRLLVTGHESLGYFADRYGLTLVGAVVPGLSSQAAVSAGALAELKDEIEAVRAPAIFTEIGTPSAVVDAVAGEAGADVIEVSTHSVPDDGTYRSFLLDLAGAIASVLR